MAAANKFLAHYAVPHEGLLGRPVPEPEDAMRFPFQRDRDRIIHTQAFRRLQGKTQVFVAGEGDHYRTRLTHTMEVAQISRDLARALRLNEDLAECIALAHDLGHPPFGHTGEDALDAWMRLHGQRFEHNEQSHRIVTVLEVHSPRIPGLNLQREILEGLLKHEALGEHRAPSLEAELVNRADEIAYTGHDCDDGLGARLFTLAELLRVPLARRADDRRHKRGTSLRGALIDILATDLLEQSRVLPAPRSLGGVGSLESRVPPRLALSRAVNEELRELRDFLHERMYRHPTVQAPALRGGEIVTLLCQSYEASQPPKVLKLQERTGSTLREAVKDYVAGMTDAYAEAQARSLRSTT